MSPQEAFLASLVVTEHASGNTRMFTWQCSCGRAGAPRKELDRAVEIAMRHLQKFHTFPKLRDGRASPP